MNLTAKIQCAMSVLAYMVCAVAAAAPAAPDVIKGTPALQKDYGWQVALIMAEATPQNGTFCGGTRIGSEWVLTAAHCLHTEKCNYYKPSAFSVGYGAVALDQIKRIKVQEIHIAKGYECGKFLNDIALLRLHKPADKSRLISLPSVADETNFAATTLDLIVAGWGFTSASGIGSSILLETKVKVVSYGVCNGTGQYNGRVPQNAMCAGQPGEACKGDSGGPLFTRKKTSTGQLEAVQIGVVSHGDGCGHVNRPGIYSRITPHLSWIAKTTSVPCTPAAIANNIC